MFGKSKLTHILGGLFALVDQLESLVAENEQKADKTHDKINVYRAKIAGKQEVITALQEESAKALEVAGNVRRLLGDKGLESLS